MGRMLIANLRYRSRSLANVLIVALGLAAAANIILPLVGLVPEPDDDFKVPYFFAIFPLFASLLPALEEVIGQRKENRLVMHALLPLTLAQIGLARVLTPVAIVALALTLAESLMLIVQFALGVEPAAWRFLFLLFFGGLALVVLQGALLVEELRLALARSRVASYIFLAGILTLTLVMLLRALSSYIALDPRVTAALNTATTLDPETWTASVVMFGLAAAMACITVALFRARISLLD